jgi:hypothetical protein
MSWEDTKDLNKTLLITRRFKGNKVIYSVYPYMRITTAEGKTYLSPLPNRGFIGNPGKYNFQAIEYIDDVGIKRTDDGGDVGQHYVSPDTAVGLTYG